MNTAQINNNDTNEEAIENNHEWTTVAYINRYNLKPRPANRGNNSRTVNNQLMWQYQSHMHTSC